MTNKILFPKEEIIDTKHFNCHQDWEIPIPGFFILAAKRKIRSVSEFSKDEASEFIDLVVKIRKGMQDILGIKDVYLFQNEDTVHNFHLWMFPRYDWMEKFGRKIESVRQIMNYSKNNMETEEIMNEVKECVKKMREYMKDF